MTIPNWQNYLAAIAAPSEVVPVSKSSITPVPGRFYSLLGATPFNGAAPSTAAVPTRTLAGALGQGATPVGKTRRILRIAMANGYGGFRVLCDRLSHQGGLSGTVVGAQTTNLPTAALTRYASGANVMAGIEIFTTVGNTATTLTASYTNQDGTAGRVTPAIQFGGTGFNVSGRFFPLPLQEGDYGVRSVESVSLAGTTATAGDFGVVLYYPIVALPSVTTPQAFDALLGMLGQTLVDPVVDGAFLWWLSQSFSTLTGIMQANVAFGDD